MEGDGPKFTLSLPVMTCTSKRWLLIPAQNSTIRYGFEAGADELPIQDFESMLRVGFNSEIVTRLPPVHAIGSIGKS